jgi:hypothetical protein
VDPNYRHIKIGEPPCSGVLDELEADFTTFIHTYVGDADICAELEEVLVAYLTKEDDNDYFKRGAL